MNIKKFLPIILLIVLIIFYFEYSVIILWDSAHYMSYVNIIEGHYAWDTWDVVRGPVFPVIIYLSNLFFGKTNQGLLLNIFIYYLLMLVFCYELLNYGVKKLQIGEKYQKLLYIVILLSIIFNPIIFGFYHSLLTEFVAITVAIISCYLAIIWLDMNYLREKRKYILISILLAMLTVFSWFLKQPYVSCGFFPLLIAYFISIIQGRKITNFFVRTSTVSGCVLLLVVSISGWNTFLFKMGNNPNTSRNPTNSLGNQLIGAIDGFEIYKDGKIVSKRFIEESRLSNIEKKGVLSLLENDQDYVIINIYKDKKLIDSDYLVSNAGNVSTMDSVMYILKKFMRYPDMILNTYFVNYLSIIDIYSTSSLDGVGYASDKKVSLSFANEISTIAFRIYHNEMGNIFYMPSEMLKRVACYEHSNQEFKGLNYLMLLLGKGCLLLFKLLFLCLPFIFIFAVMMRVFLKREEYNKILNLIIVLLGFSFLHVMLHVVTGAIIDRYVIPVYLIAYLGVIMLVMLFLDERRNRDEYLKSKERCK